MLKAGLPPLPLQDERNFYSPSITSNSKQKVKHLRVIFAKLFLYVKVGIESIINANWPLISIILRILWRSYAEIGQFKKYIMKGNISHIATNHHFCFVFSSMKNNKDRWEI